MDRKLMDPFPPLEDGETILWEGKPDTKLRFGMETMATGIFAMAMILACLGLATVIDRSEPGLFWPILAPGLIIGAVIVFAPPLIDSAKRRKTSYRLTNKMAFVVSAKQTHTGYPIPPLNDLIYRNGTPPTIYFAAHPTAGRKSRAPYVVFERIADARDVFIQMRQAAEDLHA
jgi:hypothetical protein